VKKDSRVIRGFLIGESTPEGFPYKPNQSFGKMTEMALNAVQSNRIFQIHNVSYSP